MIVCRFLMLKSFLNKVNVDSLENEVQLAYPETKERREKLAPKVSSKLFRDTK